MRLVEESYRVIAPWFPAVFTEMEDFVEGVRYFYMGFESICTLMSFLGGSYSEA